MTVIIRQQCAPISFEITSFARKVNSQQVGDTLPKLPSLCNRYELDNLLALIVFFLGFNNVKKPTFQYEN